MKNQVSKRGKTGAVVRKPAGELFPHAQVPGAKSLQEVFDEWKRRGIKPVEITEGEQLQRIVITHDPIKGELKWETKGPMDGLMASLLTLNATMLMPAIVTADAALSIAEYFTRGPGQLDLGTGTAAVMIGFQDGRLVLDWTPKNAPIAAKKLLATALLFMIAKDAGLPIERLLKLFGST